MRTTDDYVFFWTVDHRNGWGSQWYPASFTVTMELGESEPEKYTFPTAEHWMMAQKAILFKDYAIAREVLENKGAEGSTMRRVKQLGRKVKDFDEKVWKRNRERIVLEGNLHKFRQNEEIRAKLLDTGDKPIVEASPRDKIWGIGLGEKNAVIKGESAWGLNLLGKALGEVRKILREEMQK